MVPWRLRFKEVLGLGWEGVYPPCSKGTQARGQRVLGDMGEHCHTLAMSDDSAWRLQDPPLAFQGPRGPQAGPGGRSESQPSRCRQQ